MVNLIYHITERNQWLDGQQEGEYRAASLETQGFIHLSKREQILKVANAVYRGQEGLVLLAVDPEKLTAELKYEPPDTQIPAAHYEGELFPHVYGALNLDAVAKVFEFPASPDGTFTLPDGV
jgi:uncharacterized protein (DUF952 family)